MSYDYFSSRPPEYRYVFVPYPRKPTREEIEKVIAEEKARKDRAAGIRAQQTRLWKEWEAAHPQHSQAEYETFWEDVWCPLEREARKLEDPESWTRPRLVDSLLFWEGERRTLSEVESKNLHDPRVVEWVADRRSRVMKQRRIIMAELGWDEADIGKAKTFHEWCFWPFGKFFACLFIGAQYAGHYD